MHWWAWLLVLWPVASVPLLLVVRRLLAVSHDTTDWPLPRRQEL